jgi:hypothetical protein
MKLIRHQEALIESFRAQEQSHTGAEALLAIFKEAAAAITDQRDYLTGQMVFLTQKTQDKPT